MGDKLHTGWASKLLSRIVDLRHGPALQLWFTICIVFAAPLLAVFTYVALQPIQGGSANLRYVLTLDLVYVLFIATLVVGRLMQMVSARRAKSAGSRLHLRLTAVFAILAFVPTVLVAIFAVVSVNQALEGWFSDRVRTAIGASLQAAQAYEEDQREGLIKDTLLLSQTLNRERRSGRLSDGELRQALGAVVPQLERGLKELFIIDDLGTLLARGPNSYLFHFEDPLSTDFAVAESSVVVIKDLESNEFRALHKLSAFPNHYIYVARTVDGALMNLLEGTAETAKFYQKLEQDRGKLLFDFGLLYLIFAVILILTATWVGLWFAERLARPIGALAAAAQRVGAGDLDVKVSTKSGNDEIAMLGRYFNQMTHQLKGQREDLIESTNSTDRRRRLFDSVLSSITSGVIGLDIDGNISFINKSAHRILMLPETPHTGSLESIVPEFEPVFSKLKDSLDNVVFDEVRLVRRGKQENLLVRVAARENDAGQIEGHVVAFEDVTDLVSAQRMAAWGDVARRIAHEVKNPLTPIKLSAERIKRKFAPLLPDGGQDLEHMTAIIIRQTDDLRRIVNEFSKFARMPEPDKKTCSLNQILDDAIALQNDQSQQVEFILELGNTDLQMHLDETLIKQAMINLLKNAGESVSERLAIQPDPAGKVTCDICESERFVEIRISDNGKGLPINRAQLFEPYISHRDGGTGLGLPIVLKIIEDHGGTMVLDDNEYGKGIGAQAIVRLPKFKSNSETGALGKIL